MAWMRNPVANPVLPHPVGPFAHRAHEVFGVVSFVRAERNRAFAGLGQIRHHQQARVAFRRPVGLRGHGRHYQAVPVLLAEVGATAATFRSEKHLASWVGVCPGEQESAGVSESNRSPKGNRHMRRLLNQCANAAVKRKGSIFELKYFRLLPRIGHSQAIWAIAHRLCRLIWKILSQGIHYDERGPAVSQKSTQKRTARMIRELRKLGYRVEALPA
jgi:hypothetical protein